MAEGRARSNSPPRAHAIGQRGLLQQVAGSVLALWQLEIHSRLYWQPSVLSCFSPLYVLQVPTPIVSSPIDSNPVGSNPVGSNPVDTTWGSTF